MTGLGSSAQLFNWILQKGFRSILLVTGKQSFDASGASKFCRNLPVRFVRFSDFEANPKLTDASRGVDLARKHNIDLIVAIGGGSVMDMGKLIKALYWGSNHEAIVKGEAPIRISDLSLVCIPTTAGSGSEATQFAVAYIGKNKYSVSDPALLPDKVYLDGKLVMSVSNYQMICNGLDALAQAIESAWAIGSTEKSRAYSVKALRGCLCLLPRVSGRDRSADEVQALLQFAHLAGKAINIAKTTSSHAWSYALTSDYGVPHGHAVWLTLPAVFQVHADANISQVTDPRGISHLRLVMEELTDAFGIRRPQESAAVLKKYMHSLGVSSDMSHFGVNTTQKRLDLAGRANKARMSNNPVTFSRSDILQIFDAT